MTVRRVSLARARKTAGYTQESLAEALQVERTTVVRWEAGTSEPMPHIRPKLAHLLRVSCNDLEVLLSPLDATPTPQEVIASLLTRLTETDADGSTANRGDGIYDSFTTLSEWVNMNRRELIRLLGLTAATTAVSPVLAAAADLDPDERERLVGAIAIPGRVDESVIGNIETILYSCKRQEDKFGPQAVLNTVLDQQALVRGLLAECPSALQARLLALYGSLCLSTGWHFFELNNFERSWHHFDQARKSAHEARNVELSILTLCRMSYVASSHGQTHTSIDLATAAQSFAMKVDDPLLRVCVADKAAMTYAIDGQYNECMKELDTAQSSLAASVGQTSPESLAYYYTDGLLAHSKSKYMLRLGKPQEAIASAKAGLALYDKSFARDYAFCTLRLSQAYIQAKEIDEAAKTVGDVANHATQNSSARLVRELRTTRAAMQPWQATSAVKALDERLHSYGLA
jgi:DNA-binding XRE family transcriptional regulator/tetratricopeptide (TPR) repeat protein